MATKRMLIDASHPEETRVTVVTGNRLEDFDVEVESRKPLKGNIYLAKVTRVEPSLQAAFVDYGGNRHGFLAFSEIHPDYYQIPVADRQQLLKEEEEAHRVHEAEEGNGDPDDVEILGGDDPVEDEEARRRPVIDHRRYKIQEVVKRRQILLVQVVKEERGTKGAALTTYLSLAGRYCVLMPNTARGGGISRKIANTPDRKRLKSILSDLEIPDGMAVIVRTAGASRSKAEIKRDYEYLVRLWGQIRDTTLESIAPCLVHEEGNLIKRSIRDLYTKDIDEVQVEGEEGYKTAKSFMKLLIPSHAKKVQPYKSDGIPMMQRYQVESQLDAIHSPQVQLPSGGYIVINPTEALVSIDVNSGKSTKERNIEETALKTNLEAADEIARQLRLRDLAGLIVIDFIDMEVHRNQTKVERAMKDAMRVDRARIQIGRISPFGLLELSRQRLRPSLQETSSEPCPHCGGTGVRRSTESTALQILRVIEEEGSKKRSSEIRVWVPTSVALYIFNHKRKALADIEVRHGFTVYLDSDDTLIPPDHRIERIRGEAAAEGERADASPEEKQEAEGERRGRGRRGKGRKRDDARELAKADDAKAKVEAEAEEADEEEDEDEREEAQASHGDREQAADGDGKPRRRRRGRRGGRRRRRGADKEGQDSPEAQEAQEAGTRSSETDNDGDESAAAADAGSGETAEEPTAADADRLIGPEPALLLGAPDGGEAIAMPDGRGDAEDDAAPADADAAEEAKPKRRPRRRKPAASKAAAETAPKTKSDAEPQTSDAETADAETTAAAEPEEAPAAEPEVAAAEPEPAPPAGDKGGNGDDAEPDAAEASADETAEAPETIDPAARTRVIDVDGLKEEEQHQPRRRGWWQRLTDNPSSS